MAETRPKPFYAVLPGRAIGDDRLHGRHWKVLAAVAYHDRRGKNGQGCWASYKRLSDMAGIEYSRLGAAVTDLVEWGYLTRDTHPKNRRLRVLRVVYDETLDEPIIEDDPLPTGKECADRTLCPEADDQASTLCPQAKQNNIPRSGSKKHSAEAASPDGAAPAVNEEEPLSRNQVATRLRQIDDVLKNARDRPLTKGERDWLRHQQEWCAEIEDAYAHDDDPATANLGYQAERVLGDIDGRLEGA